MGGRPGPLPTATSLAATGAYKTALTAAIAAKDRQSRRKLRALTWPRRDTHTNTAYWIAATHTPYRWKYRPPTAASACTTASRGEGLRSSRKNRWDDTTAITASPV